MPLENYTTDALANAIRHDSRPMKRALGAGDRSYHDEAWCLAFAKRHIVADIASVRVKTQVALPAVEGLRPGYLDLVLFVLDAGNESEVWVEVKVDAWEGAGQLSH